jgi:hypothetical protein
MDFLPHRLTPGPRASGLFRSVGLDQGSISVANLLPSLTAIITARDINTPYGVIPAGTAGSIVSNYNYGA